MTVVVHIVDDEPSVRKAIGRLLRVAGYDVVAYQSVEQLLDQLPEQRDSGCILLDLVMPGVSGYAVLERLKEIGSTLPVVFMTGSVETVPSRADGLLKKPVSKESLVAAIERAISSVRSPNGTVPRPLEV